MFEFLASLPDAAKSVLILAALITAIHLINRA